MAPRLNAFGQPIGESMAAWQPRARPARVVLEGRHCRLEPLDPARHGADLWHAHSQAMDASGWTYLAVGPFDDAAAFAHYLAQAATSEDPLHYAVVDRYSGKALGTLSLMRIDPAHGVVEVGNVVFSPSLRRTPISTEAQYLLMAYVFDTLGYRRYEWKCDSLNGPSRDAALRLGFQFEGVFRQAIVYKGRSRDTAWYSVIDGEWQAVRAGFVQWLSEDNFDASGAQRRPLADIRKETSDMTGSATQASS
ncbi:MAG: hypothetical protein GAK28_03864 [Luteibacter sp.]|uniref:GNAT family N-acetyltransferase n=1 Tax=Luteibacter sp. TaxID=1886636 RepID=UPI00137C5143|nr:GNAT family protein [Luteibacter sp.]KAF1004662.1 MAG: hypothetical protein GAK28_03864 [Luteibacter sp.]